MQKSKRSATVATLRHALEIFEELNYTLIDGSLESEGSYEATGRQSLREVVLVPRLRQALHALNPDLAERVIEEAILALTQDRSLTEATRANQEVYTLLKDGQLIQLRPNESNVH
ncbi:MAG: type I restriction endonuclease, partial [Ktedonobacteraceae bacterium]